MGVIIESDGTIRLSTSTDLSVPECEYCDMPHFVIGHNFCYSLRHKYTLFLKGHTKHCKTMDKAHLLAQY